MRTTLFMKAIEDGEKGSFQAAWRTGTMAAMGRFAARLMACAVLAGAGAAAANPGDSGTGAPFPKRERRSKAGRGG